MFGADAINRKFGRTPPMEWAAALSYLSELQLRHGLDVLMRSGAEHMPSLPAFLATCRAAREWNPDPAQAVTGPVAADKWESTANMHLLAHVMKAGAHKSYYDEPQTRILVQLKNAWAEDMRADDRGEGVPVEVQRAAWRDCMDRAHQLGAVGGCPARVA